MTDRIRALLAAADACAGQIDKLKLIAEPELFSESIAAGADPHASLYAERGGYAIDVALLLSDSGVVVEFQLAGTRPLTTDEEVRLVLQQEQRRQLGCGEHA